MTEQKPFFTLSKSIIQQQYNATKELCDVVSYSSKTNPAVTPLLEASTDCLFSIHLPNELKNITDHSRVLFLAQAWTQEGISQLLAKGITRYVVDNLPDLEKLLSYLNEHPEVTIEQLLLRVKLKENTLKTEKFFVFGMDLKTVREQLKRIASIEQITTTGIHFHRKTQNIAEWSLVYELEDMFSEEDFSYMHTINIGGGLPATYANTNRNAMESISRKILELKNWLSKKNIQLMIEPGRFIAAPAGKLHAHIISMYEQNIILNVSVYNSDMDALIVPVKLLIAGEKQKGEAPAYAVKGITPCSLDLFRYKVYLDTPQIGDELVFLDAGAYNFTTNFVDLDMVETKVVE
jgi:ornithine decarboxylase